MQNTEPPPAKGHVSTDALEGELLATFSELEARFCAEHGPLFLSYTVLQCLWRHLERHHGMEALLQFYEETVDISNEQVTLTRAILEEDFRSRLN